LIDQIILNLALLGFVLFTRKLLRRSWWSYSRFFVPDLSVERFPRTIAEPEGQCTQPFLRYRRVRLILRLSIQYADLIGQFSNKAKLLDRHSDEMLLKGTHIQTHKLAIWISIAFDFPPGCISRVQVV
jgi:hypothetical protein